MNNDKFNKVLSQISKLLAMANGSSFPEEAASFLEKARLLMQKYQIDESQLNGTKEEIIEIDFMVAKSELNYTINLSYWLSEAFSVKCVMVKTNIGKTTIEFESSIRFIGKKADVSVSTYVYAYLCGILANKSKEYSKTHKGKKVVQAYSLGFVDAVCLKLKVLKAENDMKLTPTETEQINTLMVINNSLIKKHMNEKYGEDRFEGGGNKVNVDPNAYQKGYETGEQQGIFRGVQSTERKTNELKEK